MSKLAVTIVAFDGFRDFRLFHRMCFVDNHPMSVRLPNLARHFLQEPKIDIAIWLLRSGNGNKDIWAFHPFGTAGKGRMR